MYVIRWTERISQMSIPSDLTTHVLYQPLGSDGLGICRRVALLGCVDDATPGVLAYGAVDLVKIGTDPEGHRCHRRRLVTSLVRTASGRSSTRASMSAPSLFLHTVSVQARWGRAMALPVGQPRCRSSLLAHPRS